MRKFAILIFILAAIPAGILMVSLWNFGPGVEKDETQIFSDRDLLRAYVKKFGPKQMTTRLHELSSQYGDCHEAAHSGGRFAYELFEEKAFRECGAECHSGCYHGATEAYFRDHGTDNLSQNLNTICGKELNPFFNHQCIHGIGHGLMAWTDYEIVDALKGCDLLLQGKDSCWTGVFMENVVGGLVADGENPEQPTSGHYTKYLSDDPHFPCNVVEDKYKSACYFYQTSRMVALFRGDFGKVAATCLEAPEVYQRGCFESMGRDVGGSNRQNPSGAIEACSNVPRGSARTGCLIGAVQDSLWDPSGKDDALAFCKLLVDSQEKESCYTTIFERALQILTSSEDLRKFCEKAELAYQKICSQAVSPQ